MTNNEEKPLEVSKPLAIAVFNLSSAVVLATAFVSGVIFKKTATASFYNIAHLISTKGQVWESSKYRDFTGGR